MNIHYKKNPRLKKIFLKLKESYDQPRQHIKKQKFYFDSKGLSSQGYDFSSSHVWMWELTIKKAECWRIDAFELCCWRRLESPLDYKKIQPVHPKGDQSWVFIGRTNVEAETPILFSTWCEQLTHLKRPWCWEGLKAGGEGDYRRWDGWMASPTQWTWVWEKSASWWWTGRHGMVQSMGSQRVRHDWMTELNWTLNIS